MSFYLTPIRLYGPYTVCAPWHGDIENAEERKVWRWVAAVAAAHVCDVFWMDIARFDTSIRSLSTRRLRGSAAPPRRLRGFGDWMHMYMYQIHPLTSHSPRSPSPNSLTMAACSDANLKDWDPVVRCGHSLAPRSAVAAAAGPSRTAVP